MGNHTEPRKTTSFALVVFLVCLLAPPLVALYTFIAFLQRSVPHRFVLPYVGILYVIFLVGAYTLVTILGRRHRNGAIHTPPRYEDPVRWLHFPWRHLAVPILYFFGALVVFYVVGRPTNFVFAWYQWGGMVIALSALVLWILARIQFADAHRLSHRSSVLVTDGLYAHIRHPIYVFSFIALLGIVVFLSQWLLAIPLALLLALQTYRAYQEDAALERTFGEQYRRYKRNSWL